MARRTSNRKKRKLKPRILIMCEGETERNYFQAIKESEDYKKALVAINPQVLKAKHSSPEQVVDEAIRRGKEAKREGNPYNKIWVVIDHDFHAHRKRAFEEAEKVGFGIAFSAICFEIWYLLHFVKTSKNFRDSNELIKELQKHYPTYQKAKNNDFEVLKVNLEAAFANAEWLRKRVFDKNQHITDYLCWTDIDFLVKELMNIAKNR